ncbi:membrane protein insertase YidC [Laribacter hongkongensis]|uniref:Membrane protein insertase YidC n=1 Tax=Laribacter hongkongensis TaxID=168471 RepID=A0ABD4SW26_9NEIS|nr:membrane protein insertase YidC [Laribacter hongkongensis]MBE5528839.1 membrane protein insertase YidC [Laribacter hongkongensis]MCG9026989.1 membrane protein insertase YidC [Laribacter hongkongensis]MCG9101929.1 membrane protein insertase YidC [Laribacter hongkongensis]MCG9104801.1 membrane protein insertase YidC [Laribacter hongkongensis]MCG9113942.1 membrane protein insertase YidC [Laribacter hongkongensis]
MDTKRLIVFIVLSFGLLFVWQEYFAPKPQPKPVAAAVQPDGTPAPATARPADSPATGKLASAQTITVTTDLVKAQINTAGGDIRSLELLTQGAIDNPDKPFMLMTEQGGRTYVAQSGLLSSDASLPTHKTLYAADKTAYTLSPDQNTLTVTLAAAPVNGVEVKKIFTFKRDSYVIDVRYDIINHSDKPVDATAYYRLLRDGKAPEGESSMAHTFTGPAVYTETGKFQKVSFEDLAKGKGDYVRQADNGWVAMVQHYFVSAWILKTNDGKSVCSSAEACQFELKPAAGDLYSAGVLVKLPVVAAGQQYSIDMPLYAGPEDTRRMATVAPGLVLTKDYGWVTIIATPLFWLLDKLYGLVHNWGWAIVLLTVLVKAAFYPLSAASYRSMAKMKALAPRMQRLKEQYGDDRQKFQQATMEMYKTEKVNPLGGCLPIVVQIPVFIGLYWALLASVELRQAPWILWIHDLAKPDPYYILPALMAATMYLQTFLNPPPADPLQAKMMKIMPLAFSVMFFFFPAGLVLYWLVNNILSIAQQWWVNKQIEKDAAKAKSS